MVVPACKCSALALTFCLCATVAQHSLLQKDDGVTVLVLREEVSLCDQVINSRNLQSAQFVAIKYPEPYRAEGKHLIISSYLLVAIDR